MLIVKINGWKYNKVNLVTVWSIIKTKLQAAGVSFKAETNAIDQTIQFSKDTKGKYFSSSGDNKIKMSPTDKRIATLGRDYLITRRLTEKQYNAVLAALIETLDLLQLDADISIKDVYWRQGKTNYPDNIFKPTTFATKE